MTTTVPMPGMTDGIALLLTMQAVSIPVHLGPAWYIERLDARIEVGDHIEVVGAKGLRRGTPGRARRRGAKRRARRPCCETKRDGHSCLGGPRRAR